MKMRPFTLTFLGAALCACAPAPDPVEAVSSPITGGQLATECQFPTTVLLNGCTGTLVHPSIITTAAHCGTNHKTATFGESMGKPARRVAIQYCRTFSNSNAPDGGVSGRTLRDWAYCKLATPVTDVPIVPILMGCETDILQPGQKVVVAGFGEVEADQGGFGTKRWVETTVNRVDSGRGIQVGGMGKAPCFGDSGGPAFVKLADGTWRVFAIDSSGTADSCAAGDLMALIHKGVPWIEENSGIDITPCHDADGTWHPSAACGGFPLAPDGPGRTWANGCADQMLSGPSSTCGMSSTAVADAASVADARLMSDVFAPPADATISPPRTDAVVATPDATPVHVADAAAPLPSRPADGPVAVTPPVKGGGCSCNVPGNGSSATLWLGALALLGLRGFRSRSAPAHRARRT
jgi:hypothetical protein